MVSISKAGKIDVTAPLDLWGLAADVSTLPTDKVNGYAVLNGSTFTAMDTSEIYVFDEENARWLKL